MENSQNENLTFQPFNDLLSSLKSSLKETDAGDVKKLFGDKIQSRRTLSRIQNRAYLIDVLVVQDIVCEEYVDPLLLLATNENQLEKIRYYDKFHISDKRCKSCHLGLVVDAVPIPQQINVLPTASTQSLKDEEDDTKEYCQAIMYLSERLGGDSWMLLARKLDFPESEIRNIKANYPKVEERAYQMLWKWREENGEEATIQKIMEELNRGQSMRRDLIKDLKMGKHLKK